MRKIVLKGNGFETKGVDWTRKCILDEKIQHINRMEIKFKNHFNIVSIINVFICSCAKRTFHTERPSNKEKMAMADQ